jgi:hypothetical protein
VLYKQIFNSHMFNNGVSIDIGTQMLRTGTVRYRYISTKLIQSSYYFAYAESTVGY